ncbi:MAG: radical SAM family heme chaperone HemW [Planctomycetes bacterium]|nr:radical SAM family heme chaperone HemW [Planctomycetota bacterium]
MSISVPSSPPPLAARDPREYPEGLYIHLPFCAALCTYCDFARELYGPERPDRYLRALERELAAKLRKLHPDGAPYAPRTIYLGGGTPTALSPGQLGALFDLIGRHVDASRVEEFTAECNPGSADTGKLELLRARGVNRVSFGIQSFQPHLLQLLGRVHGARDGAEAVRRARAAGFDNLTVDLMHGLPTQSLEDLRRDLDAALALEPEHVSAYGLIYEDGTPLTVAMERGQFPRPSPEEEAAHYRLVMEACEGAGLRMYEISNYARPGREARHNSIYWHGEAYLALGVSGAEYVGGERRNNRRDVSGYLEAIETGGDPIAERERLGPEARAREALVLALRLREGIDPAAFAARWNFDLEAHCGAAFAKFTELGLLEIAAGGRLRISAAGLPVADAILSELV